MEGQTILILEGHKYCADKTAFDFYHTIFSRFSLTVNNSVSIQLARKYLFWHSLAEFIPPYKDWWWGISLLTTDQGKNKKGDYAGDPNNNQNSRKQNICFFILG